MASVTAQLASNPLLRQYAQSRAKQVISSVADFIAPTVEVATQIGRYKIWDEKHRFKIPDTRRANGGKATEITFGSHDGTYSCKPHALDVPWDVLDEKEAADCGMNLMQEGADLAAEVGALSHEKIVIETALTAIGAGSNVSMAADDPVTKIDNQIIEVIKACAYGGLMSVGVLFGANAWKLFKNHPLVRARFTLGNGTTIPNINESLAGGLFLGNPEVKTTFIVEDTAAEGIDASLSFLLDTSVLIFARSPNPTRRDPSFMKTFRLAGQWMVPGFYESPDGRVQVAKMDWSEDVKITNSTAAKRLEFVDDGLPGPSTP